MFLRALLSLPCNLPALTLPGQCYSSRTARVDSLVSKDSQVSIRVGRELLLIILYLGSGRSPTCAAASGRCLHHRRFPSPHSQSIKLGRSSRYRAEISTVYICAIHLLCTSTTVCTFAEYNCVYNLMKRHMVIPIVIPGKFKQRMIELFLKLFTSYMKMFNKTSTHRPY